MTSSSHHRRHSRRRAHTLIELVAAMVCSTMLLGGLASVMLVARQVAYTPSAAARRTQAADVVNRLADELRYATLILQQTSHSLEFLVADRNADGTAEKIRYEWSGVVGEPLYKTVNGGTPVSLVNSVKNFQCSVAAASETTSVATTTESAAVILASNVAAPSGTDYDIDQNLFLAQRIDPTAFSGVPASAISWNLTKVDFQGNKSGSASGTLRVQIRSSGDPHDSPTGHVLGEVVIPEASLSSGWNTATFSAPIRNLALHRTFSLVWRGTTGDSGVTARIDTENIASTSVNESSDAGATWQSMTNLRTIYRIYGTYTTPGATYNVTRNLAKHVDIMLQAGGAAHSRLDASVPLANAPELLSAYWRADFDVNPTATNANGDAVADWGVASGTFDAATLIGGIWYAASALETRPPNDFTNVTTVDVRCRNTSVGGNGAVMRINADRQGGQYGPLLVYLQLQADGTQTLSLHAKSSDSATSRLFARTRLPSGFIRYQLTIIPQSNVVNLAINGEDQGTFSYATYAPASANDCFVTLYADTSTAEFDYADVRVGTN